MVKCCVICGTPLRKTNFDRYFCPNCGIIEENQDKLVEPEENKKPSYID